MGSPGRVGHPASLTPPGRPAASVAPHLGLRYRQPMDRPAPRPRTRAPHADHHHGLGHGTATDERALLQALVLIGGFLVAEVVLGVFAHSLALLADAGHMLTDAGALVGAVAAIRLARRPAGGPWTYGLQRAEILSAAANGIALVVAAALVVESAISRLLHPAVRVEGATVVGVAAAGVLVNLAATALLTKADRGSLNVEGAFRHMVADLAAFLATLLAGVLILVAHVELADTAASLLVVALMVRTGWDLLRRSGRILLQAAPAEVALAEVHQHLLALPGVVAVHDLHAWSLTSGLPILTAHVVVDDRILQSRAGALLDDLQECLADHFDVEHSTFQIEPASHLDHERAVHP